MLPFIISILDNSQEICIHENIQLYVIFIDHFAYLRISIFIRKLWLSRFSRFKMETMSRESLIKAIEDRDEIIAHLARVCLN